MKHGISTAKGSDGYVVDGGQKDEYELKLDLHTPPRVIMNHASLIGADVCLNPPRTYVCVAHKDPLRDIVDAAQYLPNRAIETRLLPLHLAITQQINNLPSPCLYLSNKSHQ